MAKAYYKTNNKSCVLLKILWIMGYCVIGFGIPSVVDSRYLPTRRSEASNYGLDRLSDLIKNVNNH